MRILELFCGIGGCAAALGERFRVAAAVDVHRDALAVYAHNFPHPTTARTIESLRPEDYRRWDADLWWLSPPCQPFTRRGLRRDVDDPRARPLLAVLERLTEVPPRYFAMENVPGFADSRAHALLLGTLEQAGFRTVVERLLCPSELGMPNRRRRYYLVASRGELLEPRNAGAAATLPELLDAEPDPALDVPPELLASYDGALSLVDAEDPEAVTACFTSAYGRSPVRSGSYLRTPAGVRRFSPSEILRLLGFPASYTLPAGLGLAKAWRLVGNSLSLPPVRTMLAAIPEVAWRGAARPPEGETASRPCRFPERAAAEDGCNP